MESLSLNFSKEDSETLLVHFAGSWKRGNSPPDAQEVEKQIEMGPKVRRIVFKSENLTGWDSMLITFLIRVRALASSNNITLQEDDLPEGVQRLLTLASKVPERKRKKEETTLIPVLERLGDSAVVFWRSLLDMTDFIGEASV